ncbi:MAG: penicillin-binding protein 1A [Alphaproteobacteria bacterium]|nr:penicillin-binding protein 1A [Alphaproteobacteria bacterium]
MRRIGRFFGFLFATGAIIFLVGAAAAGLFIYSFEKDLPDYTQLRNYEPPVMTRMHAGDGSLLAEYSRERRLFLPSSAIPDLVKKAFLSAEDKNFYSHPGIDPEGIARAAMIMVRGDSRIQGASTITQQVAKNFLLTNERTFERKIREALLAFRIEAAYSKEKILELYLNEIYLGLGNYGVAAAALGYYGKSMHELTLAEAAYLAALPKAPSDLHPFRNRDRALERRAYVLNRMVDDGHITSAAAEAANKEPLGVNPRTLSPNSLVAGYFAEEVRRELMARYGEKKLYEGGLSVRTTLDPRLQLLARKALVDGLVRYDEAQGFRGPMRVVDIQKDWGAALGEVPALGDVRPWQLAVVLDIAGAGARIGLQPSRESSGALSRERITGSLTAEGIRWTRRPSVSSMLRPGDVLYVEPIERRPGEYRLRQIPEVSGGIAAMDPFTGRVLAMVGGFSFDQSSFNRATQALRQPGSSFKPLVYAVALDNGYTPLSVVLDEPFELAMGNGEVWRPTNYGGGKPAGPQTLRYGITFSKNLMTVRLARDVGMPLIAEYAKRFGVYDDMLPVLSMSLGAGETTVLRQVAAYSMLANGGRRIKPSLIDRIQDRWGRTIYRHDERQCRGCEAERWENQNEPILVDRREQVLDPLTAYQITSMMQGVVDRGTATIVKQIVGKTVAGKTGTTNDAKDVWFVGFSPDLAVGVYLGYDRPRSLGAKATGGAYAAPLVAAFLKDALRDKPNIPFRVPPGVKLISINPQTGMRSTGAESILEAFKPGTAPPDSYSEIGASSPGGVTIAPGSERRIGSGTGGLY